MEKELGNAYETVITDKEIIISSRGSDWRSAVIFKMESLFRLFRYGELNEFAKQIEAEFMEGATPEERCNFLLWRGRFFHQMCRFMTALDTYEKAIEYAEKAELTVLKARLYTVAGAVYIDYKNPQAYKEAFGLFNKAMSLTQDLEKSTEGLKVLARVYGEIARWYMEQNNPEFSCENAIEYSLKDLAVAEKIGDRRGVEHMKNQIAQCYNLAGAPDKALAWLQYLQQESPQEKRDEKSEMYGYTELAYTYHLLGDKNNALTSAWKAIKTIEKISQPDYEPYYKLALVYTGEGLFDAAEEQVKKSIKTTEAARNQAGESPGARRAYLESQCRYYNYYRDVLLKKGEVRRAAALHEMAAARSIIDLYTILQNRQPLLNELDSWKDIVAAETALSATVRDTPERIACDKKYVRLLNELTMQFEDYAHKKENPVRLNEGVVIKAFNVICSARPRAVLVILCTTSDGPGAFLIGKDKSAYVVFEIDLREHGYEKRDMELLGEKIVKPILKEFPEANRLIILPENVAAIPCLHAAIVDGSYIAERVMITYHISAYILADALSRPACSNKGVAVFSQYEGSDKDYAAFFAEAKMVAEKCTLEPRVIKAGAPMTRDAVLSSLRESHAVHIAAHAKYFGDQQFCSRLECGNKEFITPLHILGGGGACAHFAALASCESARALARGIREPYSIVSALLASGVKNVLAASDIIHGTHSFEFMESFYVYYKRDPVEAYCNAQREMIRKTRDSHDWVKYFLFATQ